MMLATLSSGGKGFSRDGKIFHIPPILDSEMQVTICQKYLHSSVVNLVILIYLRFCHKLTIVAIYAFSRYNFV